MKRFILLGFSIAGAALVLMNFSCSKSKKDDNTTTSGTDSVLVNIGNNIILPAYQSMQAAVNVLDSTIIDFNANPSAAKLSNLQTQFKIAYNAWQSTSEYNYFGPAGDQQPAVTGLNIFPTTDSLIDANIASGNFNLNSFANTAAKGFPALDYLLFNGDNTTLLTAFTTDSKAANRKQYIAAVSADIKAEMVTIINKWLPSGGNYVNTFVNGKGTSVSSSLGLLMNSFIEDLDIAKNYRLGLPLGKFPVGSSFPVAPNEVEAFYSGYSSQLLLTQIKTIQGIYLGTAFNGNGKGLDYYLTQSEQKTGANYHGGMLSDTIKAHFDLAIAKIQAIPSPMSSNLTNTNANDAFNECQRLVTLLKTDMASDLGVLIFYGDNDGD